MEKICFRCKKEQPFDSFHKDKTKKDGYSSYCKPCQSDYRKDWYAVNKDRVIENNKRYCAENPEMVYASRRRFRQANKERLAAEQKQYYENNKASIRIQQTEKAKTDPQVRLARNLRSRLRRAIKKEFKAGSSVRDLGCSISEFLSYLESKFSSGMTWENYGSFVGGWTLDHIIPLSLFDLSNRQHIVLACHYLNLQPLWFLENISKGGTNRLRYTSPLLQKPA